MYFVGKDFMSGRGAYRPRKGDAIPETLGERILCWRQAFKMSQKDLALAVGVPQQSISAWENGDKDPSGPSLEQLVRVMGISQKALIEGDGFRVPDRPWLGYLQAPILGAVGDLVAAEEGSKKTVILPAADIGEAWGVVVEDEGKRDPLTREQALAWVERAFDNQQPVWVVVRSEKKLKTKPPKRAKKP